MILNGRVLLDTPPIVGMLRTKEKNHGVSHGLSEAGYDIRIKQHIRFRRVDGVMVNEVLASDDLWYDANPGRFVIASTVEEFDMPNHLVGVVHDKSTWARRGLSVFNTVVESGWKGFLTLELVYHGEGELVIPAGAGIAQVLFHTLAEPAEYTGKYDNQPDRPVHAIES